jgi:hypothetical protein
MKRMARKLYNIREIHTIRGIHVKLRSSVIILQVLGSWFNLPSMTADFYR